jgi:predicted DNA-binding transcriptional regulator AlpA
MDAADDRLLTVRKVAERFGTCSRTVERWEYSLTLNFPKPTVINRHKYFRLSEIIAWERARAAMPRAAAQPAVRAAAAATTSIPAE